MDFFFEDFICGLPFFPATLTLELPGPEEAENLAGECLPPDSDPFGDIESGEKLAGASRLKVSSD
jgi:hypothetical protein